MCNASDRHHHRLKPLYVPGLHKRPEYNRSRLHEMGHEEIKTIPGDADRNARAKPPCTIAARKTNDGNVNN